MDLQLFYFRMTEKKNWKEIIKQDQINLKSKNKKTNLLLILNNQLDSD